MVPAQFREDFEKVVSAVVAARDAMNRETDNVALARLVFDDFHALRERWYARVDAANRLRLDDVGRAVEIVRKRMELRYLRQLYGVVRARTEWARAETDLKTMQAYIGLVKELPEPARERLLAVYRESHEGREFEAIAAFRGTADEADEAENGFRKTLAGLDVDWPGRVNAALRLRLETLETDPDAERLWIQELTAALSDLREDVDSAGA